MQILNKCTARRQALRLVCVQPQMRKGLSTTRLDRIFQLADSVEAALA